MQRADIFVLNIGKNRIGVLDMADKKKVLLLGATGSIGESTLNVIREYPELFELTGVAAGTNAQRLAEIANEFEVRKVALAADGAESVLIRDIRIQCEVFVGTDGVIELIKQTDADICISAIVGSDGLLPTITAVEQGMDVALANKESLVAAGGMLMTLAQENRVRIIPVDSEHSGILQCLQAGRKDEIERVIITASGGAFRDFTLQEIEDSTPQMALQHPTWSMGKKITVDCATLANKGLEVIEAYWLFGVELGQIEVLVHRESVIHAMVEYCDGSIMAQLANPSMSLPVLYALTYPVRTSYAAERVDFKRLGSLNFAEPDTDLFPMLSLAYCAGESGLLAPAVYSAANEAAVSLYLEGRLSFMQIAQSTEYALEKINTGFEVNLSNILTVEEEAHAYIRDFAFGR